MGVFGQATTRLSVEKCSVRCQHYCIAILYILFLFSLCQVHTGEKKYECGECGKTFREMANVKDHQLAVHLKIRPHTCHVCGKSFSLPLTLKKHLMTHSEDKDWFCFQCGKAFKCEQHLKNHQLVHDEDRETYQCEYCLGLFKRPICLKKHQQKCVGAPNDSE